MRKIDATFWAGKRVLVTGHMGFKGTWMTYLLSRLGAQTVGFGIDDREKLLYRQVSIDRHLHVEANVNDYPALCRVMEAVKPEIVFHLAAQPIVLRSYAEPLRTFQDNIIGTANVLEAARHAASVRATVIVTSDKVYRNRETGQAYREDDPLGGLDPYSASKAAAEIVTQSMIASFFREQEGKTAASVRAGNVIGGGDWAEYRLLPDAARALSRGDDLLVRNPDSTRPWQHVLEPVSGYLMLAEEMLGGDVQGYDAWNFGPEIEDALPVAEVAELFVREWGGNAAWRRENADSVGLHEAKLLSVDSSRARDFLQWRPRWSVQESVKRTARWYKDAYDGADANLLLDRDIDAYLEI